MRYGSVKHIALYYKAIPGMLRLLRQERAELENAAKQAEERAHELEKRLEGAGV